MNFLEKARDKMLITRIITVRTNAEAKARLLTSGIGDES